MHKSHESAIDINWYRYRQSGSYKAIDSYAINKHTHCTRFHTTPGHVIIKINAGSATKCPVLTMNLSCQYSETEDS